MFFSLLISYNIALKLAWSSDIYIYIYIYTLRHPYLQACKQGWVRSTLPSPPHFFRNSVMKNLLIYIVSFQIFRTSRPAVKEECFAPQTEE